MKMKHSKLGIASFIMSICISLAFGFGFILMIAEAGSNPNPEQLGGLGMAGTIFMLLSAISYIVPITTSFISFFMKDCKKLFSILGFVFSVLPVGFFVLLMILGLLMA